MSTTMWATSILAVIFVVSTCSPSEVQVHRSFTKEWKFQGLPIIRTSRNIGDKDNSFLFATCKDNQLQGTNCNVTIAKPEQPWNDTKVHKKTCNIELFGSADIKNQREFSGLFSVDRFTKDRVIMVWWEREKDSQFEISNIRVTILHMATCKMVHLTYPVDKGNHFLLSNVMVYPDTFDVTVSNKELCGTPTCRITHDINGVRIGNVTRFVTNYAALYTNPVLPDSSDRGFYICGSDIGSWKFRAMHVSPDGVGTNLMSVSVSDPRQLYWHTSNQHELYGICLRGDKKVHCAQFDDKADVKMNATLKHMSHVEWIAVHNLAEGGILMIMGNCNNNKCRNFKVMKVYRDGHHGHSVEVPGLHLKCAEVPYQFHVNVLEIEDDFCFYFACQYAHQADNEVTRSSVKFAARCVGKEEFNKE